MNRTLTTQDSQLKTVHIIAGPTASGKSARALELAAQKNGVIINADSMQVFDALPILTAQPPKEDKEKAPHVLYAHLHPNDSCSAGRWREMAETIIEKTLAAGQTPIVCGGSGLYIKALIEGLSPIPETPPEIRESIVALHEELGTPAFFEELNRRDPLTAARLDPGNKARLIRAMEVLEATGKPLAEWQGEDKLAPPAHWRFEIETIMPDREELYRRCNERFLQMLENGALHEVENLSEEIDKGEIFENAPVTKALGFTELRAYIKGKMSKEDAIERAQTETRHYAKRQVTWFRHQL